MLRSIRPLATNQPSLRVNSLATSSYIPVGISLDRTTIYARGTGTASVPFTRALYQSTDDGATWTLALSSATVLAAGSQVIESVIETDDGEMLVNIKDAASTPGRLWKSTGWSTSHTGATWRQVLASTGGYFDGRWSVHANTFGDDKIRPGSSAVGVVCEYGPQTSVTFASGNADTTDLTKARRVFLTTDYGSTWTQILDLAAFFPNAVGLHPHAAAYDPYWDRIWLTWGDTQTNTVGAGNTELLYSDDRGQTWNTVPAANGIDAAQSTTIVITRDAIILGSDNRPGIVRISRAGYRQIGEITYPNTIATGTSAYLIATTGHQNRRQPSAPILLSFTGASGRYYPALYYSTDGGTFTEAWADPASAGGAVIAYGPTISGAIVGYSVGRLLRGQIEEPGANLLPARIRLTGDGTATTAIAPHGLSAAPTVLYGWDQRATGAAFTLSADATNITATFTTAPASGVNPSIDVRYAP